MVSSPAPGAAVLQSEVRVCPECGAIAPAERTRCGVCQTALGPLCPTVPLPLPGRAWARVEVTLPCPHCATVIPLRPEAIGAPVPCPHCGQSTLVEIGWWDEAMHMAHAVVDLSFPDFQGLNAALGTYNPFAAVGARESYIDLPCQAVPSQTPLRLRAGPGAPLCQRCRNPVSVRVTAPGRATSQCGRCNDREAFSAPEVITQRFPALRALVAWSSDNAAAAGRVEPWWMLLDGLSYMRPMVQESRAQAERADAERQAWEVWQRQERERHEQESRARRDQEERDAQERAKRERETRERMERERLEASAREAEERAENERGEKERLQGELAQLQQFHRAEVDRLQREAWDQQQQMQMARDQALGAERNRYDEATREYSAREKKLKTRTTIAIALWVVLFLAVVGDLSLALLK